MEEPLPLLNSAKTAAEVNCKGRSRPHIPSGEYVLAVQFKTFVVSCQIGEKPKVEVEGDTF